MAEIKRAKQRERERIKAKQAGKIDKFEMINPVIKGEEGKKTAAAKKGKAKTQAAKKKKKGTDANSEEDSLDGFIVGDDDDVKPARKKAKTAKGKKK